MALIVTRARVKAKCGLADASQDAAIDALIAEIVPVMEHALLPSAVADTANAGLQATLNLGATEVVCGEFLAQRMREFGAWERVKVGEFEIAPAARELDDPFGLKAQGWARLSPYLKADPSAQRSPAVTAGLRDAEEALR